MSKYIGRLINLGIGRETTRGIGGTVATYNLPRTALTFDDKVIKARDISALGKLADSDDAFVTTTYGQGEIEGEIRDKSFGLLLYAMLGSLSTAGPTDSAYTHSFTVNNGNQHQSLFFVVDDPNSDELYKLVMLDQLEMTAELEQIVMYRGGFMSKKGNDTAATVPAVIAETKFTKKHVSIKLAANLAGLAAASAISIKRLNIVISKNVTLDDVLGTAEPEDILNQQLSIEGELMLNYEDETYKNYMRQGTSRAMEIKLENTDVLIGATSRPKLTMQFPKVDFFDWLPDYANNEIAKQAISFKANYDLSGGNEIISTCQLVNAVASY